MDVPYKTLFEGAMKLEKVNEGMVPSLEKIKFGRKVVEDIELMSSVDEVMDSETLLIGEISISLNCSTVSLTLSAIFKLKKGRGRPSEGRREAPCDRGRWEPRWSHHRIL